MKSVECQPMFQRNISPTSSGSKNKPNKKLALTKEPLVFNCFKNDKICGSVLNMKHVSLQYFSKVFALVDKYTQRIKIKIRVEMYADLYIKYLLCWSNDNENLKA
jgi:hypothetical protein